MVAYALLAFGGRQRRGEAAEGEQGKAKKKAVKPLANRSRQVPRAMPPPP